MVAQVEYSTQLDTLNARHSQHAPISQVFTYTFDLCHCRMEASWICNAGI